jgi:hypothetical protein
VTYCRCFSLCDEPELFWSLMPGCELLSLLPWPVVDLLGAELRWSFWAGLASPEPDRSDGPLSGVAFFCAFVGPWPVVPLSLGFWASAPWPVVAFGSDFCAPLELWPVVDDDWLLEDDELLSDFTLTLPCRPSALTVRVSIRPFASKPRLRWKLLA